jgi:hypothetical protein
MHHVPATSKQLAYLGYLRHKKGVRTPLPVKLDKYEASLLIGELTGRTKQQTDKAYIESWQERQYQESLARKLKTELEL